MALTILLPFLKHLQKKTNTGKKLKAVLSESYNVYVFMFSSHLQN